MGGMIALRGKLTHSPPNYHPQRKAPSEGVSAPPGCGLRRTPGFSEASGVPRTWRRE